MTPLALAYTAVHIAQQSVLATGALTNTVTFNRAELDAVHAALANALKFRQPQQA